MSQSQKKKSDIDIVKELIREKHPESWLIENVSLGDKLKLGEYGAFTRYKLYIYKLSPEKKLLKVKEIEWPEEKVGQVDHFAIKSHFTIGGIEFITGNFGKDVQQFLEDQKKDVFVKLARPFYRKILGFRTKKLWKMSTATLIYLFIFIFIIGLFTGENETATDDDNETKQETSSTTNNSTKNDGDKPKDNEEKPKDDSETTDEKTTSTTQHVEEQEDVEITEEKTKEIEYEYYDNCTEMRKVYPDGVPSTHPAYESKHDRDKDNYACERN